MIKYLKNFDIGLQVSSKDQIGFVKLKIIELFDEIKFGKFSLVLKGIRLKDEALVEDYYIEPGNILHIYQHPKKNLFDST